MYDSYPFEGRWRDRKNFSLEIGSKLEENGFVGGDREKQKAKEYREAENGGVVALVNYEACSSLIRSIVLITQGMQRLGYKAFLSLMRGASRNVRETHERV
jgi:hypothetical protein